MQSLKKIHAWAQMKVPLCLKCPVLSKIAFNFTFNNSGWGTLIPYIISLSALNHNLKYYLELLHNGCVKRYFL